jgi:hypothetical protein
MAQVVGEKSRAPLSAIADRRGSFCALPGIATTEDTEDTENTEEKKELVRE